MAPSNKNKRLWNSDQDSDTDSNNEHFCNTSSNWPWFLVVESSSDDLPRSKLSPFVIQKGFQAIARTLKSIKRLRDGSFLVEYTRKSQAVGLLTTTRFIDRPVHVSIHKSLNSSRGVICCHELSAKSGCLRMPLSSPPPRQSASIFTNSMGFFPDPNFWEKTPITIVREAKFLGLI